MFLIQDVDEDLGGDKGIPPLSGDKGIPPYLETEVQVTGTQCLLRYDYLAELIRRLYGNHSVALVSVFLVARNKDLSVKEM